MVKCVDCFYSKPWVTDRYKTWCNPPELYKHRVENRYSLRYCLLFRKKGTENAFGG